MSDSLVIAGRAFKSRLIVGTGKYRTFDEMRRCHEATGAGMVTVAVEEQVVGLGPVAAAEPPGGDPAAALLEILDPRRARAEDWHPMRELPLRARGKTHVPCQVQRALAGNQLLQRTMGFQPAAGPRQ